ncbi:MAG: hypothetical protein EAZ42_04440 [Verrucomicrobia bacterium]|nr:MAG: hypothetical protein EAZ42_04440 [Verrucomicrobiota bacterium]
MRKDSVSSIRFHFSQSYLNSFTQKSKWPALDCDVLALIESSHHRWSGGGWPEQAWNFSRAEFLQSW